MGLTNEERSKYMASQVRLRKLKEYGYSPFVHNPSDEELQASMERSIKHKDFEGLKLTLFQICNYYSKLLVDKDEEIGNLETALK